MSYNIQDLATEIASEDVPLLISDTCALLDIVRLVIRSGNAPYLQRELSSVKSIYSFLNVPSPEMALIMPYPVQDEINEHRSPTISDVNKWTNDLLNSCDIALEVAKELGLPHPSVPTRVSLEGVNTSVVGIFDDLIAKAKVLNPDDEMSGRAFARVVAKIAPARQGKQEPKDCVIVEQALSLGMKLRSDGYDQKIVFLSSNKADFQESNRLRIPLDSEFGSLNIDFALNWQHTKQLLGV